MCHPLPGLGSDTGGFPGDHEVAFTDHEGDHGDRTAETSLVGTEWQGVDAAHR